MPRRFNYTDRQKINRDDVSISLHKERRRTRLRRELQLADYKLDKITPPPQVYVEAYRGAWALWKRFDFGRFGTIRPPDDRSLDEFGVPEGILFRVKVSATGDDALGRLLAEADGIAPRLAGELDSHGQPLIQHVASSEIGDDSGVSISVASCLCSKSMTASQWAWTSPTRSATPRRLCSGGDAANPDAHPDYRARRRRRR